MLYRDACREVLIQQAMNRARKRYQTNSQEERLGSSVFSAIIFSGISFVSFPAEKQFLLICVSINNYPVAFIELSFQNLHGKLVLDIALDGPF